MGSPKRDTASVLASRQTRATSSASARPRTAASTRAIDAINGSFAAALRSTAVASVRASATNLTCSSYSAGLTTTPSLTARA